MQNLPSELRSKIASYLDDKSRRMMRLANTEWFKTIKYSDFKFYFTTNEQLPQILKRLAQYSWPISVDFKNQKFQLLTKENCDDFGRLTHLTGLRARFYGADPHPFTNLTNLEYVSDLPTSAMKHFTKLKSITLGSSKEAIEMDLVRFTNLESVEWSLDNRDEEIDPFAMINNAYKVTRLVIETPSQKMSDENNLSRFTSLRHFSLKHPGPNFKGFDIPYLPNLESLVLRMNSIVSLSSLHRSLTDLTIESSKSDLSSLATLTKLKRLNLSGRSSDQSFLTALTNLENIVLRPKGADYSKSLECITSEKLTSLEYEGEVDMQYIAKFGNKLQSLIVWKIATQNNEALQLFSNLTSLRMINCQKEHFPIIETLTKLEELNIRMDDQDLKLSAADVLHLDNLTGLKSLAISTNVDSNVYVDDGFFRHAQLTKIFCTWSLDEKFVERIAAQKACVHACSNKTC